MSEITKDQIYEQLDNIASTKEYLKLAELAKFELKDDGLAREIYERALFDTNRSGMLVKLGRHVLWLLQDSELAIRFFKQAMKKEFSKEQRKKILLSNFKKTSNELVFFDEFTDLINETNEFDELIKLYRHLPREISLTKAFYQRASNLVKTFSQFENLLNMVYKFDKDMMWEIFNKSPFPNRAIHYFNLSQMDIFDEATKDGFFDQFIAREKEIMKLIDVLDYNVLSNDQKIKIIKKATTLADDTPSFKIVAIEILKNFSDKRWAIDIKNLHDKMKSAGKLQPTKKKRSYRSYFFYNFAKGKHPPIYTLNDYEKSYSIFDYFIVTGHSYYYSAEPDYDWYGDEWSFLDWEVENERLIAPDHLYESVEDYLDETKKLISTNIKIKGILQWLK
ncbi:hypothetical protein [Campylobacter concisus]